MAATSQATFTPAATSHAAGDVVGGAQEFKGLGIGPGGCVTIVNASLRIANSSAETATWVLYLFDVTPPSAVADDGAYTLPSGDYASFLGTVTFAQTAPAGAGGATQYIQGNNVQTVIRVRGGSVFGYLTTATTLTPGAVAHVVTLGVSSSI